jgi:P4 family phage/plasmid primase-like protien
MDETNTQYNLHSKKQRRTPDHIVNYFLHDEGFVKNTLFATNENLFFEWKNGFYQPMNEKELHRTLWKHVNTLKVNRLFPEESSISANSIKSLYETMKIAHTNNASTINTPFIGFNDGKHLNLENFEIEDSQVGKPIFYGLNFPSSELLATQPCPIFERFLETTLVDEESGETDQDLITFVQEIFGYCLTNSIKAHATFFFYGSGRNGKSVLLDVLEKIIGEEFISHMSIQTLTTQRFAAATLVGKKLNIASEEESKFIKCDVFKSLVAGDSMTVERKHRDPFQHKPNVKFLFATNKIPVFDSTDAAIRDRVYIIPFYRYFTEEERDRDLSKKLEKEIGGILRWCVEGAKRVIANKYRLTEPESVKLMSEKFQKEQSSALTFIDEECEVTGRQGDYIIKARLYDDYSNWCTQTGRHKKNDSNFFKDIKNVFREEVDTDSKKRVEKRLLRAVTGIKKVTGYEGTKM